MSYKMKKNKTARGYICAVTGGMLWGLSGCLGQFLTQNKQLDPTWLTTVRLLSAGAVLIIISLIAQRKNLIAAITHKRELLRLCVFGIFGMMLCQLSYITAIAHTNAPTATVIQYAGPVLVCIAVCVMQKRAPEIKEVLAVLLAVAGTFLVATHADPRSLVITPTGLFWCIVAALSVVTYTLTPGSLTETRSSVVVSGVGMSIGGAVLFVIMRVWQIQISLDTESLLAIGGIVLAGTVAAFSLYLQAVSDIGAVKASVIASIEPVASAVIAWLWLGQSFEPVDILGFSMIISTVFVLAARKKEKHSNRTNK